MRRTTIIADEDLLLEAKHLADRESKTLSALIQDALREHILAHRPVRRISCAGIVNVPMSISAEEMDRELIDGLDPIEGWSPDRSELLAGAKGDRARTS